MLSACTPATIETLNNNQTVSVAVTQTTTTQQVDEEENRDPGPLSDEQILDRVNDIIGILGLDVVPDLDFTARVENGVVTLDGTLLYPDEEYLILSIKRIPGVVKIISNFDLLAE